MLDPEPKRDYRLDVLKGIGITLVVFAHTYYGDLQKIVYLFHMPLFFIASGCIFAIGKQRTIKKSAKGILLPYLLFSIVSFIYWWLIESMFRGIPDTNPFDSILPSLSPVSQQFLNIFIASSGAHAFEYNVVLWFLPCLFFAILIYHPIFKLKAKYQIIFAVCLYVCFCIISHYLQYIPFYFDISLLAATLLIIGRWLYVYLSNHTLTVWSYCVIIILSAIGIAMLYYSGDVELNLFSKRIPNFYFLYPAAILGFIMIWSISNIIEKHDKIFRSIFIWLGANSLLIMALHEPIKRIIIKLLTSILRYSDTDLLRQDLLPSIVVVIITITLCCLISMLILRFCPWIVGRHAPKTDKALKI